MTFDVEINGRAHAVSIDSGSNSDREFLITVDGRRTCVDVARVGPLWSLIFLDEQAASRQASVIDGRAPGELRVELPSGAVQVVVNGRHGRRARHATPHGMSETGAVVTPMPGKVVRVLVALGDEVRAGQPLVIVEAMKMENELRAPKAGRVKELVARDGIAVEGGRILVLIE